MNKLKLGFIISGFLFAGSLFASDTIKLYTSFGLGGFNIDAPVDISMVINDQLMILKNHPSERSGPFKPSYVEVDSSLSYKEISQAEFNWLSSGKKYYCKASNLPLYVQDGDYNTATQIRFECSP